MGSKYVVFELLVPKTLLVMFFLGSETSNVGHLDFHLRGTFHSLQEPCLGGTFRFWARNDVIALVCATTPLRLPPSIYVLSYSWISSTANSTS